MSIRMIIANLAVSLIVLSPPAMQADAESKEKIISEIFDVMQYEKMLDQTFAVTREQMISQLKALGKDADLDLEAAFGEYWDEIAEELKTGIRPFTSQLWAKYYTEEELKELLEFYRSDVGRKSIETSPQIMQETMAWANQKLATSVPQMKERIEARVKAAMEAREEDSNP